MANQGNRLAPKKEGAKPLEITYQANGREVRMTPGMVKKYLVSGNPDAVTDQEIMMFMMLCKNAGLDPWLREAYCIKYGNSQPATLVVGKEAFQKRADAEPAFDGQEAGIIVLDADGKLQRREGTLLLADETLLGGWAKVYRKDRSHPSVAECSLSEYIGRKKDGSINGQWGGKPATMIRKVALVQALREAFPARLGALYTSEEKGVEEPVEAPFTEIPDEPEEAPQPARRLQEPRPMMAAPQQPAPQDDELPPPPMDDDFFSGGGL